MRIHPFAVTTVVLAAAAPVSHAQAPPVFDRRLTAPAPGSGCFAWPDTSTRSASATRQPARSLPRLESQPVVRLTSPKKIPKALRWTGIGLMAVGGVLYVWGSSSPEGEASELREYGAMVAGSGVVLIEIGIAIRDRR